jgi:hypothetical protein
MAVDFAKKAHSNADTRERAIAKVKLIGELVEATVEEEEERIGRLPPYDAMVRRDRLRRAFDKLVTPLF